MSIVYRTSEVAQKAGVHPNTIRFYEELHYLPPVSRRSNGYRVFTDAHVEQLKFIQMALRCEILHSNLRKKAIEMILLCAGGNYEQALEKAKAYQALVQREKKNAEETVDLVHQFLASRDIDTMDLCLTRRKTAEFLGVTIDVLRNWELNGLIKVPRKVNGYRLYTGKEIKELKIIRTLRHANYSLMSILRMLNQLRKGTQTDLKRLLDTPSQDEDIVYVTDRLLTSLSYAECDAREMIAHISKKKP